MWQHLPLSSHGEHPKQHGFLVPCRHVRKQYKSATEMETHLSSYDHHHKKVRLHPSRCLAE